MHAFISTQEIALNNGKFYRRYPSGTLTAETPIDKLIIDTAGESHALNDYFKKQKEEKDKQEHGYFLSLEPVGQLHLVTEGQLIAWPHLPVRMGRISAKLLADQLHMHAEPEPLTMQCALLKAKKPTQKHFRCVVVNAFGTNLGDTTLGMTAMRVVADTLAREFESFSVDFLLGPHANPTNREIVGHDPWVGQAFFESPTLQDFSRYDAYFDFTNLTNLPKFNDMPFIDWYLWWMGLDPAQVPAERKRNSMNIRWADWRAVSELLKGIEGKRVLFNPKGSVPLRSFPPEQAVKFVRKLLDLDGKLQVVIDQPLNISHKRLVNLSGKIDSPGKFQALIAQLDGVITVDTYASHAADACSVPAVILGSSVPVDFYSYYPFIAGLEIPNARNLAAWGKTKLATEEEWFEIKDQYTNAWAGLDARQVLDRLNAKIDERSKAVAEHIRIRLTDGPPQFSAVKERAGIHQFCHENASPMWANVHKRLALIADAFLKPGMSIVLAGPGQSELPIALGQAIAPYGTMHLYEPRSQRRMLIEGDMLRKTQLTHFYSHSEMPVGGGYKHVKINDNDPFGETDPILWGNLRKQLDIPVLSIDALGLSYCQVLFLMSPMPFKMVVEGAMETIRKYRSFLLLGPISRDDARQVITCLAGHNYQFWAESAKSNSDMENLLLLGFPNEQKLNLQGFARIQM